MRRRYNRRRSHRVNEEATIDTSGDIITVSFLFDKDFEIEDDPQFAVDVASEFLSTVGVDSLSSFDIEVSNDSEDTVEVEIEFTGGKKGGATADIEQIGKGEGIIIMFIGAVRNGDIINAIRGNRRDFEDKFIQT